MLHKKIFSGNDTLSSFNEAVGHRLNYKTALSHIRSIADLQDITGDNFTAAISAYHRYNADHGLDDPFDTYRRSDFEYRAENEQANLRRKTDVVFERTIFLIMEAFGRSGVVLPAHDVFVLADRLCK